jgi:hypothetical protein
MDWLQKTRILGTSHIIRKVLQSEFEACDKIQKQKNIIIRRIRILCRQNYIDCMAKGELFPETTVFMRTIQDQVNSTNNYKKYFLLRCDRTRTIASSFIRLLDHTSTHCIR